MRRILRPALALAVLSLAAVAPAAPALARAAPAARAAVHPVSGLKVIPLRVRGHAFRVEVARSDAEQQKGLMFRTAMGANEGMLFPEASPRRVAFWMRNTVLPLDIVFIGADRRILNIVNAIPYDETPLPSAGPAIAVLELNAGRTRALGIRVGDKVEW
ncbi:DUF192 domain-containing protein [Novosphingobium bradum]|uniref:DUF192 domain-containing protein n=1 Tax=Novosphingobium bradum TaxID=1737444 RepID=A0ABV7IKG2_9SPHN